MSNVTLKQLRAFVMIAHERSFTGAAARLNISQSALTLSIRDLERKVGLRLFDRSTRSVEMTTQAGAFLPIATRLLEELDLAVNDLRTVADRSRGSVVVSSHASFINAVLAPTVARVSRTHPGISVRVMEESSLRMSQSIIEGAADFGITTIWRPTDELRASVLLEDCFGVLCRTDHPLARIKGPIDWAKLAPYQIVALPKETGTRATMDHHPKIGKLLPPPRYEVSNISGMISMVQHGVGVAIVNGIAIQLGTPLGLTFRQLKTPNIMRELHFVSSSRRSLSPAAEYFAQIMLEEVKKLSKNNFLSVPKRALLKRSRL